MSQLTTLERNIDAQGASTLVNTLMDHDDEIYREISFWQRSIGGKKDYMTETQKLGAENIKTWYELESKTRSYHAPNWKISADKTLLLARFRNDPNYHIKNIVELTIRSLIFEMLRADGIDAKVVVTSDSDDAFGGADVIAIINTNHGEEYIAFDIAISESQEYLGKKEERTETICYEFNAVKNLKHQPIPRMVFAVPPRVMAQFIVGYMKNIATQSFIDRKTILPMFKNAATDTIRTLTKKVHDRIGALHIH